MTINPIIPRGRMGLWRLMLPRVVGLRNARREAPRPRHHRTSVAFTIDLWRPFGGIDASFETKMAFSLILNFQKHGMALLLEAGHSRIAAHLRIINPCLRSLFRRTKKVCRASFDSD